MGEMAFVGAALPQGAVIVFLSLVLLRTFRFFVHFLSGVGILGVITPMFGHEWNGVTATVAILSLLVGAAVSKYLSEENPPFFLFLVILGIGMIVLNWGFIVNIIGFGLPSVSSNLLGLNQLANSLMSSLPF